MKYQNITYKNIDIKEFDNDKTYIGYIVKDNTRENFDIGRLQRFDSCKFMACDFFYSMYHKNFYIRCVFYRCTSIDFQFLDCDFYDCVFNDCKFQSTDFKKSRLMNCKFQDTIIEHCDFQNSILNSTYVHGINCYNLNTNCPKEGSFIAWKALAYQLVAKLLIPSDAERSSSTGKKCRASKALVLGIYDCDGKEMTDIPSGYPSLFSQSIYVDNRTRYHKGKMVIPDGFTHNPFIDCGHGIHFFMKREDALNYTI